jgi:hypothetical protein
MSFTAGIGFPLSVLFHRCSILTFVYFSLLREGEIGAAGTSLKLFWNPESFGQKVLSLVLPPLKL